MSRSAIAILSTENLLHNFKVIREKVKPAKIIAMVKANAYGHGLRSVALRLAQQADILGVASIDEALALRQSGVQTPIMLAEGVFDRSELITASTERFHVVFHNDTQLEWLEKSQCPLPLQAWLKINTGMGRLGFAMDHALARYERLYKNPQVEKPVRLLSHFACADQKNHPLNKEQLDNFQQFTQKISTEYSLCNSAALFHFPDVHYDYVRPGLSLYGVSPIPGVTAESLGLKPVMTLQTSLISVQTYDEGTPIGYGARYRCPERMPIGVVAFGYGDGYPITVRDGAPLLVNNVECPLVGRISMDMLTVDLRNCPTAQVGDPVILWGNGLPIERVVAYTQNIPWDMLTGVQHRVKFLWTKA